MNRFVSVSVIVLVLCSAAAFCDDWEFGTPVTQDPNLDQSETPSTPHTTTDNGGNCLFTWSYVITSAYGSPLHSTTEGQSTAGWTGNAAKWQKQWDYTGCESPVPYKTKSFTIVAAIDWFVCGDADNWGSFGFGEAQSDGQAAININAEPDDPDADHSSSAHWSGKKEQGSSFTNVALNLSWPPGLTLVWTLNDEEYESRSIQPETKTWTGDVSNETAGGTRLDYIRIEIQQKSKGWAKTSSDAWLAGVDVWTEITTFDFHAS